MTRRLRAWFRKPVDPCKWCGLELKDLDSCPRCKERLAKVFNEARRRAG